MVVNKAVPLSAIAAPVLVLLVWALIAHVPASDMAIGSIDPGILQVIGLALLVWLAILLITLLLIGKLYAYTKLPQGNPYCAAFVSWVYGKAGYAKPRIAWSPDLFPKDKRILAPQPADLLGIFSVAKGRIASSRYVKSYFGEFFISSSLGIELKTKVQKRPQSI